jgi:hypothetical protein
VDLAVIATNSDVRRSCVESLLEKSQVKNFLLEKFLFSTPEDYKVVADIRRLDPTAGPTFPGGP